MKPCVSCDVQQLNWIHQRNSDLKVYGHYSSSNLLEALDGQLRYSVQATEWHSLQLKWKFSAAVRVILRGELYDERRITLTSQSPGGTVQRYSDLTTALLRFSAPHRNRHVPFTGNVDIKRIDNFIYQIMAFQLVTYPTPSGPGRPWRNPMSSSSDDKIALAM